MAAPTLVAIMERFVQLVVAGGITLVAGLWVLEFVATMSAGWIVGAGLVAAGVAGLAVGIHSEIDSRRLRGQ